jgi:pSer/pThr/pTyr-binding forkhead associated (FHA) protein
VTEGYAFPGPVEVELFEDTRLKAGKVGITASFIEGDLVPSLILPDGVAVAIGRAPIVIGRLPECTVVLADTNISRRHAQVTLEGGDVVVTDLGSTNGTFVNGRRIARAVVKPGDEVLVGASRLRIEIR